MKKIQLFLLLSGSILWICSLRLPLYKDSRAYEQKYYSINSSDKNAFDQFYLLREESLTAKTSLEDYAFTCIVLLVALIFFDKLGGMGITSPVSKNKLRIVAVLAATLNALAAVSNDQLDFSRGSIPHWADSMGISLMLIAPMVFILSLVWAFLNFYFLQEPFKTGVRIFQTMNIKQIPFLLTFFLIINFCLILEKLVRGHFINLIPLFVWAYFYMSLIAGRMSHE